MSCDAGVVLPYGLGVAPGGIWWFPAWVAISCAGRWSVAFRFGAYVGLRLAGWFEFVLLGFMFWLWIWWFAFWWFPFTVALRVLLCCWLGLLYFGLGWVCMVFRFDGFWVVWVLIWVLVCAVVWLLVEVGFGLVLVVWFGFWLWADSCVFW